MGVIDLTLAGDGAWPELAEARVIDAGEIWRLAALDGGMASGAVSLALRFDLDPGPDDRDGPVSVIGQTSLAAWIAVTCALRARFPDAFAGTPLEDRS